MQSDRHRTLVTEDDPEIAEVLVELVKSLDHDVVLATTLSEQRAALDGDRFCCCLQDLQIPAREGVRAATASGKAGAAATRKRYPERHNDCWYQVPIIAITSTSKEPDDVFDLVELGVNGFIHKPFGDPEIVMAKIRAALRAAGAENHQTCVLRANAGATAAHHAPEAPRGPVLSITGETVGKASVVHIDGHPVGLRPQLFSFLVALVALHQRTAGKLASLKELGFEYGKELTSNIQTELKAVLPPRFRLIEADGKGGRRLNPAVQLGHIDWYTLSVRGDPAVRKIAAERLKSRGGSAVGRV